MDSSSDEEGEIKEEDPSKLWIKLAQDWTRCRHSEKVRIQRILYQPGHKIIVKKGGKKKKRRRGKKSKPKPGEQTRWCVPHAVYHAYLPQECVNELYSGSQYDHINLPPHSTEWSLVDRTQGLVFFLTHLIPTEKHDLFGTTKSVFYLAFLPGKKRLVKFNSSQHQIYKELASTHDESQLMLFFEMRWVIVVPFYFVVTFSMVLDQSQAKNKKAGAKAVDYSGVFDQVVKKLCRTMKLVHKYDPQQMSDPEAPPKKIRSCMFSQPKKKKKPKKGEADQILTHPYALSKVEKTVVQPLRAGNVQVTQRPFSAKKSQPMRQLDGQPIEDYENRALTASDTTSLSVEKNPIYNQVDIEGEISAEE